MNMYLVVVDGVIRLVTSNRTYAEDTLDSFSNEKYKCNMKKRPITSVFF